MLPGASPEIMASSVSTPLEREFGRIAGVSEMTAQRTPVGQTSVTLQIRPQPQHRQRRGARRRVGDQRRAQRICPRICPNNPTYRKVNPADSPITIIALTSDQLSRPPALYDAASTILAQKLAQIPGVGQVIVGGSSSPAVRIDVNPTKLNGYGLQLENVRAAVAAQTANEAKGGFSGPTRRWMIGANDQLTKAADYRSIIITYQSERGREAVGRRPGERFGPDRPLSRPGQWKTGRPDHRFPPAGGKHHLHRGRDQGGAAPAARRHQPVHRAHDRARSDRDDPRLGHECRGNALHLHRAGRAGGLRLSARDSGDADSGRGRARFDRRDARSHVPLRLQRRQPLPHGADHFHRICRRRRHCRPREHHPASRGPA